MARKCKLSNKLRKKRMDLGGTISDISSAAKMLDMVAPGLGTGVSIAGNVAGNFISAQEEKKKLEEAIREQKRLAEIENLRVDRNVLDNYPSEGVENATYFPNGGKLRMPEGGKAASDTTATDTTRNNIHVPPMPELNDTIDETDYSISRVLSRDVTPQKLEDYKFLRETQDMISPIVFDYVREQMAANNQNLDSVLNDYIKDIQFGSIEKINDFINRHGISNYGIPESKLEEYLPPEAIERLPRMRNILNMYTPSDEQEGMTPPYDVTQSPTEYYEGEGKSDLGFRWLFNSRFVSPQDSVINHEGKVGRGNAYFHLGNNKYKGQLLEDSNTRRALNVDGIENRRQATKDSNFATGGKLVNNSLPLSSNAEEVQANPMGHGAPNGDKKIQGTDVYVEDDELVRQNPYDGSIEVDSDRLGTAQITKPIQKAKGTIEQLMDNKNFKGLNKFQKGSMDRVLSPLKEIMNDLDLATEAAFQHQEQMKNNQLSENVLQEAGVPEIAPDGIKVEPKEEEDYGYVERFGINIKPNRIDNYSELEDKDYNAFERIGNDINISGNSISSLNSLANDKVSTIKDFKKVNPKFGLNDILNQGKELLPFVDNIIASRIKDPKLPEPNLAIAPKFNTKVNVNDQISDLGQSFADSVNALERSGNATPQAINYLKNQTDSQKRQILSQKENAENQLENQNAKIQADVVNKNRALLNESSLNEIARAIAGNERMSKNVSNLIEDLRTKNRDEKAIMLDIIKKQLIKMGFDKSTGVGDRLDSELKSLLD